jgi:hypothetical protein
MFTNVSEVDAFIIRIALMMEAAGTSETLVNFFQTSWSYNPEDSHLPKQLSSSSSEDVSALCGVYGHDKDNVCINAAKSTNTTTAHKTFVFILFTLCLARPTEYSFISTSHLQSFADRRLTSPLGKSVVADNRIHGVFQRLHCFMTFLNTCC